jgi:hypothetical protein
MSSSSRGFVFSTRVLNAQNRAVQLQTTEGQHCTLGIYYNAALSFFVFVIQI